MGKRDNQRKANNTHSSLEKFIVWSKYQYIRWDQTSRIFISNMYFTALLTGSLSSFLTRQNSHSTCVLSLSICLFFPVPVHFPILKLFNSDRKQMFCAQVNTLQIIPTIFQWCRIQGAQVAIKLFHCIFLIQPNKYNAIHMNVYVCKCMYHVTHSVQIFSFANTASNTYANTHTHTYGYETVFFLFCFVCASYLLNSVETSASLRNSMCLYILWHAN